MPNANAYRALCAIRQGQYDRALRELQAGAIIKFAYTPMEMACKCFAEIRLGKKEEARTSLKRLREQLDKSWEPEDIRAYDLLLEIEATLTDRERREASERVPNPPDR